MARVVLTDPAEKDLDAAIAYVHRDSPSSADALAQRLLKRVNGLADSIARHEIRGWSRSHQALVRMMIEYPYLI